MECSDLRKSHMLMELFTVPRQVFKLYRRVSDIMSVYFQQVAAITIKSLVNHHRFHAAAGRASHLLLHNLILITIQVIQASQTYSSMSSS